MTKKISIGTKPTNKQAPLAADAWVDSRAVEVEPMKRLTIDISESLHRKIKAQCAMNGTKIADEVRELLNDKYGNV
ncbi:MAG: plasmid partition protein ParG [Marinagarivorans sp.]|nr:plasmid partition protein ParG [Marinagarivorans sp.]